MPVIKCKMCGGDLNIVEDSSVCECEYCGTKQTVPKVDDEKKLKLFERANRLRTACEFDKAAGVYESIVADFDEEAEAYWGLILCKFGIEYVDDPATGYKIPTCHRSSFDSLMDDPNFDMVMECADPIARKVYREEAKQIEELRKRIIEVSSQEEPYDIFISYKELDDEGQRTLDSVIAQDIYSELTEKGYRVFFSRISLEDKLGVEYEPYIFAALNSAKVMLVVGTDFDYFNAVWVKNEWSRFLMLIASGQKKTLIPVFKGIDAYDMPKEFRKLAAQDVGKVGAMQDLVRGVEKLIGKKKLEPDIEQGVFIRNASPSIEVLLKRGYMALEDSDWDKASELFDHVLNIEVSNAEAYLGLAMAEFFCRNKDDFRKAYITPGSALKNNKRLARARQFGDEQMSCWIQTLDRDATDKNQERLSIIAKCQHMIVPISGSHSVGLKSDGRVLVTKYTGEREYYCGQCEIRDWTDIVAIAANSVHTVGIKADGTVISTKYIGNPEWYTGECEVSSWTNVKSIALGSFFTMGVKENGKVITTKCIRNDLSTNYGQCDVNEWTNIVFISLGEAHTVGLKANGTVIATGKNDYGQCDVSGWTDIIAIASGRDYTVGLKSDGTVVAVGNNENGQCEVSGWSNVASIASRGFYTVGIKTDGTVVAAGKNTYGQCNVSEWTDIVSVSLGGICTLGLKTDGTVVAAGQNRFGECDVIGWSDIVAIASGGSYSLGIKSNGTVVSTLHNRRHSPYNHYSGECDVGGWKLFDNYETIEAERKAAAKKAEAERKAAAEKAEAELKAKIEALSKERTALQTELPNLRGLFSGKRRREIEARLAEIEAELKKLG